MGLNEKLKLDFKGEGVPFMPHPNDATMEWAFITMDGLWLWSFVNTALQTLNFL